MYSRPRPKTLPGKFGKKIPNLLCMKRWCVLEFYRLAYYWRWESSKSLYLVSSIFFFCPPDMKSLSLFVIHYHWHRGLHPLFLSAIITGTEKDLTSWQHRHTYYCWVPAQTCPCKYCPSRAVWAKLKASFLQDFSHKLTLALDRRSSLRWNDVKCVGSFENPFECFGAVRSNYGPANYK